MGNARSRLRTRRPLVALAVIIGCHPSHDGANSFQSVENDFSFQGSGDVTKLTPVVKCVASGTSLRDYTAVFAVSNSGTTSVVVPLGSKNRINGDVLGPGLPTEFAPGTQYFPITFGGTTSITWTLGSRTATASKGSTACPVSMGALGPTATVDSTKTVLLQLDPTRVLTDSKDPAVVPTEVNGTGVSRGASSGAFAVNPDGSASYTLPLWTPPGRVDPGIALTYNSRAGASIVGVGWQIAGLSQITRCPRTIWEDYRVRPVGWDADGPFCLDGQRLVPAGAAEFRLEHDPFTRIIMDTAHSNFIVYHRDGRVFGYGTSTGKLVGSRRERIDDPAALPPYRDVTGQVLAWALDRVSDRTVDGNAMTITYKLVRSGPGQRFSELLPTKISYPPGRSVELKYDDEVVETVGTPPSPWHPKPSYRFVAGFGVAATRVVTRIRMSGPNPVTSGLLREYALHYNMQAQLTNRALLDSVQECDGAGVCHPPTAFHWDEGDYRFQHVPLDDANIDGPVTVVDLDGDGRDDILYQTKLRTPDPRVFSYYCAHRFGIATGVSIEVLHDESDSCRGLEIPVDVMADGHPLVDGQRYNQLTNKFESLSDLNIPGDELLLLDTQITGDLNGDGLTDYMHADPTVSDLVDWQFQLNRGLFRFTQPAVFTEALIFHGTNPPQTETVTYSARQSWNRYVADVDGSGRAALLFREAYVDPAAIRPVEGDRYRVLTMDTALSSSGPDQSPFFPSATTEVHSFLSSLPAGQQTAGSWHYVLADINGDGIADAVQVPNGGGVPSLAINNGTDFEGLQPQTDVLIMGSTATSGSPDVPAPSFASGVQVADWNEDGVPDLIVLGSRGTGTTMAKAYEGDRALGLHATLLVDTDGQPIPTCDERQDGFSNCRVLDVNGDGLLDILQFSGGHFHLYVHQGKKADQIDKITDGVGKTVDIDYRSIQGAAQHGGNVYTPGTDCSYPEYCVRRGLWVVAGYQITADSDQRTPSRTRGFSFRYADARTDLRGRGWLGMASYAVRDEQTGATQTTTYHNGAPNGQEAILGYPLAGLPVTSTLDIPLDPDLLGNPRSRRVTTTTTYEVQPQSAAAPVFPPSFARPKTVRRTVEDVDDGAPTTLSSVLTTNQTFDDFNNVTLQTIEWSSGDVYKVKSTYANVLPSPGNLTDPTVWMFGLLTRSEVTHTTSTGETSTRVTSYDPDLYNGLTKSMTVEPDRNDAEVTKKISYQYNRFGQLVQSVASTPGATSDPSLARTETIAYEDGDGVFPSARTNALGQTTMMLYHPGLGVLAFARDPNGLQTRYEFDGFGRLRITKRAGQATTHVDYEATQSFPLQRSAVDVHLKRDDGGEVSIFYNELGNESARLVRTESGARSLIETRFTGQFDGQIAATSRPYQVSAGGPVPIYLVEFEYDHLERLKRRTLPDQSKIEYAYAGLDTTVTDPRASTTITHRDEQNRVVGVDELVRKLPVDPSPHTLATEYHYGPFDVLERVDVRRADQTAPLRSTVSTFDVLGRRKRMDDPEAGVSIRTYNGFDEVVAEQLGDPAKSPADQVDTIAFGRDPLGRVFAEQSKDGTNTFQWDTAASGIGLLAGSQSFDGVGLKYGYDGSERLTTQTWTIEGTPYTVDRVYDGFGRVSALKYPTVSGKPRFTVGYHYNALTNIADAVCDVRTTTTCDPGTPTANVLWRATARQQDGQLTGEVFGNGDVTTRSYDGPFGRPHTIDTLVGSGPTKRQSLEYAFDALGNLLSRTDHRNAITETFGYDSLNRLTTWSPVTATGKWSTTFDYDDLGAMTSRKTTGSSGSLLDFTATWAPNATRPRNDLVVNGTPYSYDARGRNDVVGTSSFRQRQIDYTAYDLPKKVTLDEGSLVYSFKYDADHNRVLKRRVFPVGTPSTVYVGGLYEQHLNDDDGFTRHLFYIPGPERVVAQYEIEPNGPEDDTFAYWHDDHLGSIDTVVDSKGKLTTLKYDPFGARIDVQDPTRRITAPRRVHDGFTFHEHDDDVTEHAEDPGFINMKGRIYDPRLARFVTADALVAQPVGQGFNRYAYVGNNPMSRVDPTGFCFLGICIGGSGPPGADPGVQSVPAPAPQPTQPTTPDVTAAAATPTSTSSPGPQMSQGETIARDQASGREMVAGEQRSAMGGAGPMCGGPQGGGPELQLTDSNGTRSAPGGGGNPGPLTNLASATAGVVDLYKAVSIKNGLVRLEKTLVAMDLRPAGLPSQFARDAIHVVDVDRQFFNKMGNMATGIGALMSLASMADSWHRGDTGGVIASGAEVVVAAIGQAGPFGAAFNTGFTVGSLLDTFVVDKVPILRQGQLAVGGWIVNTFGTVDKGATPDPVGP